MNQVIIVTEEENLRRIIREELELRKVTNLEKNLGKKLSRHDAAHFLEVSYQTMHNWVKAGLITQYGIGKKKFFLRSELIEVMNNEGKK